MGPDETTNYSDGLCDVPGSIVIHGHFGHDGEFVIDSEGDDDGLRDIELEAHEARVSRGLCDMALAARQAGVISDAEARSVILPLLGIRYPADAEGEQTLQTLAGD